MESNLEKYNALRAKHPIFTYEAFDYQRTSEGLKITFHFNVGNEFSFQPSTVVPCRSFYKWDSLSDEKLSLLVFNIGMVELVSYWKSVCSPTIVVKPYSLTSEQIKFWKKLYFNGLSEFFYLNGIIASEEDFVIIQSDSDKTLAKSRFDTENSFIVPIGGGKDSVVTLELLSQAGKDICPMIINPRGATTECAAIASYDREAFIEIKRTIHPLLLKLNAEGYLNGHTPFSAMLAFYTLLASAMTGRKFIALSNESSANESTIIGTNVNHQYSKSLEFENDFRRYVKDYISDDFDYFSFLRPLTELQIAMLFARNRKYFSVFKSCNVGSKTDVWCGSCAKCLFAYIILSPFIEPETLNAIFGKSMLDDESLKLYFAQLIGKEAQKPFECVGTVDEVNSALTLTIERFYSSNNRPLLLKDYELGSAVVPLNTLSDEHNVPEELLTLFTLEQ